MPTNLYNIIDMKILTHGFWNFNNYNTVNLMVKNFQNSKHRNRIYDFPIMCNIILVFIKLFKFTPTRKFKTFSKICFDFVVYNGTQNYSL